LSEPANIWKTAEVFRFLRCGYEPASGRAELAYSLGDGAPLVETLDFPYAPWPPEPSRQDALRRALSILHLVAGVSYYKATAPSKIEIESGPISPALAEFLNRLYLRGLAEFAHVNGIDLAARIDFGTQADERCGGSPAELILPDRALVAMGGGKDSLVALSLLQEKGIEVQPVCVGQSQLIEETVRAAGLPLLRIERHLAPQLAQMNREGALNGHVPVTAINSAILLCAAILYGYRYVVFANERSADEATLPSDGGDGVNHQYSKSSAFEAGFREVIAHEVSSDIEYFSILRPFSELDIARRFSHLNQFHKVFSSCNRNFHLDGPRAKGRWCGDCPKCRFTALALAPFLEPADISAIQGIDLLDDPAQTDGFRALCRLGRDKPFECVGEAGEARAALVALAQNSSWREHAVVLALAPELEGLEIPAMEDLMRPLDRHFIPPDLAADSWTDGD
jgi:7-cyano-7-deazaguanine synthase in queuosine biosynthesis